MLMFFSGSDLPEDNWPETELKPKSFLGVMLTYWDWRNRGRVRRRLEKMETRNKEDKDVDVLFGRHV